MTDASLTTRQLASIAAIASVCHEANRAYCASLGDHSQPSWDDAPALQKESAFNGVLKIASHEITRPEQQHESWSAQKLAEGWVYGPVKDAEAKTHHCLVPFKDLPPEQQTKDVLFFSIARALLGLGAL